MRTREGVGAEIRPPEERRAAAEAAAEQAESKSKKPDFGSGVLEAFLPTLTRVVTRFTRGGTGDEEAFEVSVDMGEAIPLGTAVAMCRHGGIKARQVAHALLQLPTIEPQAHHHLDATGIAGLESSLTKAIARLLAPPKAPKKKS